MLPRKLRRSTNCLFGLNARLGSAIASLIACAVLMSMERGRAVGPHARTTGSKLGGGKPLGAEVAVGGADAALAAGLQLGAFSPYRTVDRGWPKAELGGVSGGKSGCAHCQRGHDPKRRGSQLPPDGGLRIR